MWTVTDAYNTVYSPNYFSFFFLKAKKTYVNEVKHAKKLNNENKKNNKNVASTTEYVKLLLNFYYSY